MRALERPLVVRKTSGAPAGVRVAGPAVARKTLVRGLRDAAPVVPMTRGTVRRCPGIDGGLALVAAAAGGASMCPLERPFVLERRGLPGVGAVAAAAIVRKVGMRGLDDAITLVGVTRRAFGGGSGVDGRISRVAGRTSGRRVSALEWPGVVRAPRGRPGGVAVAVGAVLRQHSDVQRLRSLL